MTKCRICKNTTIVELLDLGMQPVCNQFLESLKEKTNKYQLLLGLCKDCGLVQLINPFPALELQPKHDWVTYTEPEWHLDDLANILTKLPNIDKDAKICGISFKDDSLLERMKKLGFNKTMRLDLQEDLGSDNGLGGVETIQNLLNISQAKNIVKRYGKFDIVLARHILEHAYKISEFIKPLKNILTPNGYILFEVPDCTKPFEQFDYSTIWEEHIVYFTSETFKNCFSFESLLLERFKLYSYPMENSLVGIVKPADSIKEHFPNKSVLEKENARALAFSQAFPKMKDRLKSFFSDYKRDKGKTAVFGAGHNTCLMINAFELKDYVDCVIDDNKNKQGLFMPGSHLPILSPSVFLNNSINLCILNVNPTLEEDIIAKNRHFIENGGKFISFCPASEISLYTYPNHLNYINFKEVNKGVYYATNNRVKLGRNDINIFKEKLIHNQQQKIRLCTHKDTADKIHEMFIILGKNIYIRPHKHLNKSESFHVIEGTANIIIFDEEGKIFDVIKISDYYSGNQFYYKIYEPYYHTVCVTSSFLVFQETTSGPFNKSDAIYAPWSPEENDIVAVKAYMERLAKSIDGFLKNRNVKK